MTITVSSNNQQIEYSRCIQIPLVDVTSIVISANRTRNVKAARYSEYLYHAGGLCNLLIVLSVQAFGFRFGDGRCERNNRANFHRFHAKNHAKIATRRNTSDFVATVSADTDIANNKHKSAHRTTRFASLSRALLNVTANCSLWLTSILRFPR